MSDEATRALAEIKVDRDNLYREEMVTDLRIATIRHLCPIRADGSPDPERPDLYIGQTQLMSQAGMLPVQAAIEATSLEEAIQKFPAAIQRAVDELVDEARQLQREEASRIVIPRGPLPGGSGSTGGGSIIT